MHVLLENTLLSAATADDPSFPRHDLVGLNHASVRKRLQWPLASAAYAMQLPPSDAMLLLRLERAANPRSTLIVLRSWALRIVIFSVFGLRIVSCFEFIGVYAILFLTRCVAFEYICVLSLHHLSTHSCSGLFARRCVVYSCRSNLFVVVCCCSCLQWFLSSLSVER